MKKIWITIFVILTLSSCQTMQQDAEDNLQISPTAYVSVSQDKAEPTDGLYKFVFDENNPDYREAMRRWVMTISKIAKSRDSDFFIIPQNCSPLFTDSGYADGNICIHFINSIDGTGQEGLVYGNDRYNIERDMESKNTITELLNVGTATGISVLSINYCDKKSKMDSALEHDMKNGYISFVSPTYGLTDIPTTGAINENADDINTLGDAKNWLCMLNPEKYESKEDYINALCKSNYDIIVMDAYFYDDIMLNKNDVSRLKYKANGGKRIVISYLSIGEAEDYRYYWNDDYYDNPPEWMLEENPNWVGNYPVKYWDEDWQRIIAVDEDSYLNKIIDMGFDGVYLDIVDGYQTFEDLAEE